MATQNAPPNTSEKQRFSVYQVLNAVFLIVKIIEFVVVHLPHIQH
jgi:hypothetical protein